ncbi:MAG: TonB-dependent receptor [Acidobacteriota bacterium]
MGEIVVVGSRDAAVPGVGASVLTRDQMWTFDRSTLAQAVNVMPGVVSTFDANGRRNESDIFVRGFGRWQVPLMLDGVRIYLPADNRLDFSRFLTADIAEVQIQKGYASVLDGPGAMGGAINLVSRIPTQPFEAEASGGFGGRSDNEGWNGYVMAGTRQRRYYLQGSLNYSDRDFWTLSGNYQPRAGSLQPGGRRLSSDNADSRLNLKAGFTPNSTDEYTVNYTRQEGEKGAPLNVNNNPPVPPNSYWRWPYWDVSNASFLTRTRLGLVSYVKTKLYYNTFENGLDAFDDGTYTTQSLNGRFRSPYDDRAYGAGVEFGRTSGSKNILKGAASYRTDVHTEQQINRPTHPTLSSAEPVQEQSQNTWSIAVEDTVHVTRAVDIVGGVSYDKYHITKAEEFNATRGIFEYPKGGSDAFNWQSAVVWRYNQAAQIHASVSDRARFPVIFELYSTRFGTATPNPTLGPERATNLELGWKTNSGRAAHLEGAVFYSDVRNLIQTIVLSDTTTQTRNVGDGRFYGAEVGADAPLGAGLRVGGNYTVIKRRIHDALLPNLRPTGVPTHKAFLYAAWQPIQALMITPSLDVADDRWSDVNATPAPAFPYVQTGAYALVNLAAEYTIARNVSLVFGFRNLTDDNYELAWGFPQPGRTYYFKTRLGL